MITVLFILCNKHEKNELKIIKMKMLFFFVVLVRLRATGEAAGGCDISPQRPGGLLQVREISGETNEEHNTGKRRSP